MPTSPVSEQDGGEAAETPETSETPETPGAEALAAEVASLREQLTKADDRYKRALADLDNYRKRVERDGQQQVTRARRAVLVDWLEALDSVERALQMEPGDPGLLAVLAQMESILARSGVTRIDAAGAPFDPQRHEAIDVRVADDRPDRTVLDVARSGFATGDDVLRPALVVVSNRPQGDG